MFCFSISANAQEQISKASILVNINQEIVEKYKEGKFKDALESAEKSLALTTEILGENDKETAFVYANIGEIYIVRKKYDDAAENFQKSVSILEKAEGNNELNILKHLSRLGTALALDGKEKEAEAVFEKSITTAEIKYGKESSEIIPYLKTMTDFFIYAKEFDKAEELFIRRYLLSRKLFGDKSEELEGISDQFHCFTSWSYDLKEGKKSFERFNSAVKTDTDDAARLSIINGEAISLPKPQYPVEARRTGSGGVFNIKVEINEEGKVTSAKSICSGGNKYLNKASEEAALRAKFQPTTVNGKPVKVTGIVVYRYVP